MTDRHPLLDLDSKTWGGYFAEFKSEVESVKVISDNEIAITLKRAGKPIEKVFKTDLYARIRSAADKIYMWQPEYLAQEVVRQLLIEWKVHEYHRDTLVGLFDIQAYKAFLNAKGMNEAIFISSMLRENVRSATNTEIGRSKVMHWILSDSIVVTMDTFSTSLNSYAIQVFLATCSTLMTEAMHYRLPLRGAIGGGDFYMNDDVIVSTALANAKDYEDKQNWLGAVVTPQALELIRKYDPDFDREFKEREAGDYRAFLGHGKIPWKNGVGPLDKDGDYFFIKPDKLDNSNRFEKCLPDYFSDEEKIHNSKWLYE